MTKPHNTVAAEVWGQAGAAYDFISFGLADGLCHAVQMLWPRAEEHILDLATGTGWTARRVAELGARVTAVDIAEPLLAAARSEAAHLSERLTFQQADAEALPFADGAFDGVISTYGVIFAGRPDRAAAELARVTRPGGRLVLAAWRAAEGYIADFFTLIGRHSAAPPPEVSPMVWGDPDWLQETLGGAFELHTEPQTTTLYAPGAETLWRKYLAGFGPIAATHAALDAAGQAAFRQDFLDLHAPYRSGPGLRIERHALLVRGSRR